MPSFIFNDAVPAFGSEDALHYQAMLGVQSRLQLLHLEDIANGSIVVKKLPLEWLVKDLGLAMPAVVITPARDTMNPLAGVNERDDVVFGVLATIFDADNREPTLEANLPKYLRWREQISRAFMSQRLAGVTEIFSCAVEPSDPVLPQKWTQQLYSSSLLLKFTARVPRGLNA